MAESTLDVASACRKKGLEGPGGEVNAKYDRRCCHNYYPLGSGVFDHGPCYQEYHVVVPGQRQPSADKSQRPTPTSFAKGYLKNNISGSPNRPHLDRALPCLRHEMLALKKPGMR